MYGKTSHVTRVTAFCGSLCFHLIILCMLLVAYKASTFLIPLTHVTSCDNVSARPSSATVIFQQPKLTVAAPAGNTQPTPTIKTTLQESTETTTKMQDLEKTPTTYQDTIDLVMPTSRQKESALQPSTQPRHRKKTSEATSAQKKIAAQAQLRNLFHSFSQNVQTAKKEAFSHTASIETTAFVKDRYIQKVLSALNKSLIGRNEVLYTPETLTTVAEISVTIDQQGMIKHYQFKHALPREKLKTIENLFQKMIYSSGLLPPMPASLAKDNDTITVSFMLHIFVGQGINRYFVTYR